MTYTGKSKVITISKVTKNYIRIEGIPNINVRRCSLKYASMHPNLMKTRRERLYDITVGDYIYMRVDVNKWYWEKVKIFRIDGLNGLIVNCKNGYQHLNCIDTIKRIEL